VEKLALNWPHVTVLHMSFTTHYWQCICGHCATPNNPQIVKVQLSIRKPELRNQMPVLEIIMYVLLLF